MKRFYKIYPAKLENKYFRLKDDKALNCQFVNGDILKLNEIVKKEDADVILFRNALYHFSAKSINSFVRIPKPKEGVIPVLENIFKQVHNSLSKEGIFVIGADESLQALDCGLTQKLLAINGFEPLYSEVKGIYSVWKKCPT